MNASETNPFNIDLTSLSVREMRDLSITLTTFTDQYTETMNQPDCDHAIEVMTVKLLHQGETFSQQIIKEMQSREYTKEEQQLVQGDYFKASKNLLDMVSDALAVPFDLNLHTATVTEMRDLHGVLVLLINLQTEIIRRIPANDVIKTLMANHWKKYKELAASIFNEVKSRKLTAEERKMIEGDLASDIDENDTAWIEWLLETKKAN